MDKGVLGEIEGLREEVRRLNEEFGKSRYEDLRRAFCDEIRVLVGMETKGLIDPEMIDLGRSSECRIKDHCFNSMREAIDEGLRRFSRGDTSGALALLCQLEGRIKSSESPCLDAVCTKRVLTLVREVKMLISIFDAILGAKCDEKHTVLSSNAYAAQRASINNTVPDPAEIERALVPLSNRRRVALLKLLSQKGIKFTEMSRTLNLRTGHLQFHLRVLATQGYITVDRDSRTYMITDRGRAALSWAEAFTSMLRGENAGSSSPCTASAEPAPSESSAKAASAPAARLGNGCMDDRPED
ncbi:MAG: winged helix-turn-helix transcriptional regulator [Candidatus Methanosuratus sp.]|nr:winged helix-turn-helix transcriptional regulator [Candidatus Methanosuratincola sp.]